MRKIGYIRVSSESQNLKRQMQQLNEIGMDIIYQEKISGATMDRKELQKLLEELQPGDIIFVTDLTRITRSTKDLFSLIEQIRDKNAYLKSLKDSWLELSEENPYSQFLIRGLTPEQVKNSHKKFFTCSRAWYKRLFSCF